MLLVVLKHLCSLSIFAFTLDGEHHADCCLIKDESLLQRYSYFILNIYLCIKVDQLLTILILFFGFVKGEC